MGRLRKIGRELAAQLVAEGRLTDEKIAAQLGCARRTLTTLKTKPAFQEHVKAIVAKLAEESLKFSIARREGRLAVQQDMEARLLKIVKERAQDPELAAIPGGQTGLICKTIKGIGKGDDFRVVEVYEADVALVKTLVGLHEQAAKEMGQFVESEVKAKIGLADMIAQGRKRVNEAKKIAPTTIRPVTPVSMTTKCVN